LMRCLIPVFVNAVTSAPSRHVALKVRSDAMVTIDRVVDFLARKVAAVALADGGQIDGDVASQHPFFGLCSLTIGTMAFGAVLQVGFFCRRIRQRGSRAENRHQAGHKYDFEIGHPDRSSLFCGRRSISLSPPGHRLYLRRRCTTARDANGLPGSVRRDLTVG